MDHIRDATQLLFSHHEESKREVEAVVCGNLKLDMGMFL